MILLEGPHSWGLGLRVCKVPLIRLGCKVEVLQFTGRRGAPVS